MVQYAEIKDLENLIKSYECNWITPERTSSTIYHLKKYKDILEGWYGDEQHHNKVEEGVEL